jgi:uncharacterized protein (DUF1330 family)
MPAYWIVRVDVKDREQFAEYAKKTPEFFARYGARYLVRGGQTESLEGPDESRRIVVIEFPSLEAAEQCYRSAEYQEIRQLRVGAAVGEIIAVEGVG